MDNLSRKMTFWCGNQEEKKKNQNQMWMLSSVMYYNTKLHSTLVLSTKKETVTLMNYEQKNSGHFTYFKNSMCSAF